MSEKKTTQKNENKNSYMIKRSVRIKRTTYETISKILEDANAESVTEFIDRSLEFYVGYICATKSEDYLLRTIASLIDAKLGSSDDRNCGMIFKLAVEVAMQNRILAREIRISDTDIEEIRRKALEDVRRIWR